MHNCNHERNPQVIAMEFILEKEFLLKLLGHEFNGYERDELNDEFIFYKNCNKTIYPDSISKCDLEKIKEIHDL
jgi:hypothetical protein